MNLRPLPPATFVGSATVALNESVHITASRRPQAYVGFAPVPTWLLCCTPPPHSGASLTAYCAMCSKADMPTDQMQAP